VITIDIIEKNITKRADMPSNDPISCYMDRCAQQNANAFGVFFDLLSAIKPARILEIGTGMGGLTFFLQHTCNALGLNTHIRTYDVIIPMNIMALTNEGVEVKIIDVFGGDYKSVDQDVIDYIQQDGLTLVLCDGKSKWNEFNILSEHIKPNDFIMAHDYFENQEKFDNVINGKIWNWNEIQYSEIEESVKKYNLVECDADVYQYVAWVCMTKK
jgi:tRNA A58 N-methylase Trm61